MSAQDIVQSIVTHDAPRPAEPPPWPQPRIPQAPARAHAPPQMPTRAARDPHPRPPPATAPPLPHHTPQPHHMDQPDRLERQGGCAGLFEQAARRLRDASQRMERDAHQRRQRRRATPAVGCGHRKQDGAAAAGTGDASLDLETGEPDPSKWRKPGYLEREGLVQRKGVVVLVLALLAWVYLVYVWRLCVPAIRQTNQKLATRSTGVGLLSAFNVLWVGTMFCYVRILGTGPGFVRDHVGESDPPPSPSMLGGANDVQRFQGVPPDDGAVGSPTAQKPHGDSIPQAAPGQIDATAPHSRGPGQGEAGADLPIDASIASMVRPFLFPSDETSGDTAVVGEAATTADRDDAGRGATRDTQTIRPPMAAATGGAPPKGETIRATDGRRTPLPEPRRQPEPKFPLAPSARYCYRCRRVRPPRSHHCRRCGTCVLRMDHHCPWVGGCVGARNHKLFMHFVLWVTALELFVLVSNATLFSRGVFAKPGYEPWTLDGFLISLFPITGVFFTFTAALTGAHIFLLTHNLTTLEQMELQRMRRAEDFALSTYLSDGGGGGGKKGWHLRERRELRRKWDDEWGDAKREGNLFWLDHDAQTTAAAAGPKCRDGHDEGAKLRRASRWEGYSANWRQVMGPRWWEWIVPVTTSPTDGITYFVNPRHDAFGNWRPRREWPEELR